MRIAKYKQVDTKIVEEPIIIPAQYDEEGNAIIEKHVEIVKKEVPVMGMVYRDATTEEIAEMERQHAEMPNPEPSPEERLAELEAQNQMLTQCLMEMSQIVYA